MSGRQNYFNKPLIIGGGQLGQGLREKYPNADLLDFPRVDLTSRESIEKIDFAKYSIILNAAAWTQVDVAEKPELFAKVEAVNAGGPEILAEFAKKFNTPLVHISSDYVFDGTNRNHDENEKFSPINVYGKTKAEGDQKIREIAPQKWWILRSSWVIGKGVSGAAGKGTNFVKIMANLAKKGVSPGVANDQIGRQTYVDELVRAIDFLAENDAENGVYNLTNDGKVASLAEITKYIFAKLGRNPSDVTEVSSDEYYAAQGFVKNSRNYSRKNDDGSVDYIALRPKNSDLNLDKIHDLGFKSEDYFAKIDEYLTELETE